jgi:hypothetical protein
MNTSQIEKALKCDEAAGPFFHGVYACNLLPISVTSFPASFVANTDTADLKGEHWVAFYFDQDGNVEYFDSYGFAPMNEHLERFFTNNGQNQKHNTTQLQGLNSTVCGQYCIAFIAKRSRNEPMTSIVKQFKSKIPGRNDRKMAALVNEVYDLKPVRMSQLRKRQYGGVSNKIEQCCCSKKTSICRLRDGRHRHHSHVV